MFPKILEVLTEAPEVYDAADVFLDAGDWIVWVLTGRLTRNSCVAGYKALWRGSYPSREFLSALHPRLATVVEDKLPGAVVPVGSLVGGITEHGAALTGLPRGCPVAAAHTDAHVAAPALGVTSPGVLIDLIGTSSTMLVSAEAYHPVPGICGIVKDGILPGLWGYEAGLGCVGDAFAWFADNCLTPGLVRESEERKIPPVALLSEKIAALEPGECGVMALNWFNGNRNPLGDGDLTGLFLGLSLTTTPIDMFRALVESTAFGTRLIVENLREHGVAVDAFVASGGIARKSPAVMQIWADVLGMEIQVAGTKEGPAKGSAIYAALAAGSARGGYDTLAEAALHMASKPERTYVPNPAHREVYDALYRDYLTLFEHFGRGGDDVMKRLLGLRRSIRKQNT